jgi:hypothetical protein
MWTGYASHREWCLHQNSHSTCRQQVRSWSDLLTSRGRLAAAFLFFRWLSEFGAKPEYALPVGMSLLGVDLTKVCAAFDRRC